ncbi:magnesium transporter CorA family protein [Planococcus lenghuensis]|uniref:Magnesium transporter CorA n=1 Tax=Planococcus lenghuensis TaxID=2213202 RepID=A0A1Q2KVT9_9BACL|nr:magnesium transporter CorA family protein [Planococcus lenghuensis]AQQ52338.1 hypothetical protein B0X71_03910 [Planococcus lenghuensis]
METHSFFHEQWKWHEIDFITEEDELRKLIDGYHVPDKWIKQAGHERRNTLLMSRNVQQKEAVWGSLVYNLDPADRDTQQIFHFFLSRDTLITGNMDFLERTAMDKELVLENMKTTDTAIEGLMIIIDVVIDGFLKQIDAMEVDIRDLIWKLQQSNGEEVLDELMNIRHQLLVIKNLIIPVQEIHMSIKEAFEGQDQQKQFYKRAGQQLDRCHFLINEYKQEVSTMVELEDVTASVMGNEVMKTLTVITLLFTPISAWGAWWGMNFKHMPELDEKFAYLFAGLFIFASVAVLYFFIQKKGWFGDLLSRKKKR